MSSGSEKTSGKTEGSMQGYLFQRVSARRSDAGSDGSGVIVFSDSFASFLCMQYEVPIRQRPQIISDK